MIIHISLQLPFTKFVLTNAGYLQDQQMYFPRIRTVGFTLADHNTGPFHLEIDYIKLVMFMYQPKHFKYHYQSKAWLFCRSVTNGLLRKVSFNFSGSQDSTAPLCVVTGMEISLPQLNLNCLKQVQIAHFAVPCFLSDLWTEAKLELTLLWNKLYYYFPNLNSHFHSPL